MHSDNMVDYTRGVLADDLVAWSCRFLSWLIARKKPSGTSAHWKVWPPASSVARAGLGGLRDLA